MCAAHEQLRMSVGLVCMDYCNIENWTDPMWNNILTQNSCSSSKIQSSALIQIYKFPAVKSWLMPCSKDTEWIKLAWVKKNNMWKQFQRVKKLEVFGSSFSSSYPTPPIPLEQAFMNSHSKPPLSLIICPHHRNLGTYGGPRYDTTLYSSLLQNP